MKSPEKKKKKKKLNLSLEETLTEISFLAKLTKLL